MMGCSLLAGLVLQGIGTRVTETADAVPLARGRRAADGSTPSAYSLAAGK